MIPTTSPAGPRVRVLGIDPGSVKTGWGVVDVLGARRVVHVDNGVLFLDDSAALPRRLLELSRRLVEVASAYAPDVAVVEDVFVAKGARSALVLGQARGAALAALGMAGLDVHGYATARVKARVAGRGAATKEQVQEMVRVALGLPEVPFEDAADALAVALCHAYEIDAPPALRAQSTAKRLSSSSSQTRKGLLALARAQGKL